MPLRSYRTHLIGLSFSVRRRSQALTFGPFSVCQYRVMESSKSERQPLNPKFHPPSARDVARNADVADQTTTSGAATQAIGPGATTGGGGLPRGRAVRNMCVANLLMFLLSAGGGLFLNSVKQYVYMRIAEDLMGPENATGIHHSRQPCLNQTSMNRSNHSENDVQSRAAQQLLYLSLAHTIPALFTNVFLGAYSDHVGRRFLFTVSVSGYVFLYGMPAVVAYFDLNLNWLFVGYVLNGCCGSYCAFLLAVYVYNAENTPPTTTRTMGMAVLGCGGALAAIAGEMGAGYFIEDMGFFYPMLTAALLAVAALVVEVLFLSETCPRQVGARFPSPLQAMRDVFGFYYFKSAAPGAGPACRGDAVPTHCLIQKKTVDRRGEYVLGIVVFFLIMMPHVGSGSVDTLYVMNRPFCWPPRHIGNYNTIRGVAQHTVSLLSLKLMSRVLKDDSIGVMGMVSAGGGYLVLSFADRNWMVYTAPVVAALASLGPFAVRSLMSQRAPTGKQGSLFAGQAVIEVICGATGSTLFDTVYAATVGEYRGAAYLTMAVVVGMAIVFMGLYIRVIRRSSSSTARSLSVQVSEPEGATAVYHGL